MNTRILALTGIHTDIGKTICSAVMVQALGCDYWKPIQAGGLAHSDTLRVRELITRTDVCLHPEAHQFERAASPHAAARAENTYVHLDDLSPPYTTRPLLIETAGGVCSPMTQQHTVADVLAHFAVPTLLVVRHYLGSISHTLSAIDALNTRGVHLLGLLVNGEPNSDSEQFISEYARVPILARIDELPHISRTSIHMQAQRLAHKLPPELRPWSHMHE